MFDNQNASQSFSSLSDENKVLFICSLTNKLFRHPVIASNGKTYEAGALLIEIFHNPDWIRAEQISSVSYAGALAQVIDENEHGTLQSIPRYTTYDFQRIFDRLHNELNRQKESPGLTEWFQKLLRLFTDDYLCPISNQVFCYPVILSDSKTYEAFEILNWFRKRRIEKRALLGPETNEKITSIAFNLLAYQTINQLNQDPGLKGATRYSKARYPGGLDPVMNELLEFFNPSSALAPVPQTKVKPLTIIGPVEMPEPEDEDEDDELDDGEALIIAFRFTAVAIICIAVVSIIQGVLMDSQKMQNEEGSLCFDRSDVLTDVTDSFYKISRNGIIASVGYLVNDLFDCRRRALGFFAHPVNENNGANMEPAPALAGPDFCN